MAMRRFEIAQDSMRPNLTPGDEVVAVDTRDPSYGDVVVFTHPERAGFWMVKRVAKPPSPIRQDQVWVLSDNPDATMADSRTLGPLLKSSMWTVIDRLDSPSFNEACMLLAAEDESLRGIVDEHGLPEFWARKPGFPTLVWLILEQQVSLESGAAMYRRVHDAARSIRPEAILDLGEASLRSLGVTRQKSGYLIELSRAILEGDLDLDRLGRLPEPDARTALTAMRGIGPWTADAYLLSALRHPDVFPVGDRALQVGTGEVLGMTSVPDPEQLDLISQPWKPIRAAAARLIWHDYLARRGRVEPTDPTAEHDISRDGVESFP